MTDWMGDDGWLVSQSSEIRKFNYIGDTHVFTGEVVGKRLEDGRCVVDIEMRGTNQRDTVTCPAKATVALPSREHGPVAPSRATRRPGRPGRADARAAPRDRGRAQGGRRGLTRPYPPVPISSGVLMLSSSFSTFRSKSARMGMHRDGIIAAGILCAIAATVASWSGPLASASRDLRIGRGSGDGIGFGARSARERRRGGRKPE